MTLKLHIQHLRDAIWRGERQVDLMYAECDHDIGDTVKMEEYDYNFQELKRQQQVRREQLARLLKKEANENH